ncbi:unnamed protein product, partial [Notodromas monacha]
MLECFRRKERKLGILTKVEETKLSQFAKRVVGNLKEPKKPAFNEEETDLLVKSLGFLKSEITEAEVCLVNLFSEAVRNRWKAEDFLIEELEGGRGEILAKIWTRNKDDLIAHFSQPQHSNQVESVSHSLSITTATSKQKSVAIPASTFI